MTPTLEVLDSPQRTEPGQVNLNNAGRYSACVVTPAQALKKKQKSTLENDVSLSDTVLMSDFSDEAEKGIATDAGSDRPPEPVRIGPDCW